MKFIQVTLALALLVASTYAIKCTVSGTREKGAPCESEDKGTTYDTCYICKMKVNGEISTTLDGCRSTGTGVNCDTMKTACTEGFVSCKTDNCNACPSPASALQASAVLLLAVAAAMML